MKFKRIGIYFFYDKDGIVDEYNIVLLEDLKKNLEKLLVVVNGNLNDEGRLKFEKVADEILVRENKGFDVWAYKEGIEHLGWEEIEKYDELVQLNFTNYGPIYPFSEMFESMERRNVDIWGIVMRYGFDYDPYGICKYGYIPDHISSSFTVIRKSLMKENEFRKYWDEIDEINSYEESVCKHEAIFTEHFRRKGYKIGNYIESDDLKDYWDYPLMLMPLEIIKNRRCPIFKRKTFYNLYEEVFIAGYENSARDLYEYIRSETDYDINLIWDNILRTENMWEIKERLQLNYVVSSENQEIKESNFKIVFVIASLNNNDFLKLEKYLKEFHKDFNIILMIEDENDIEFEQFKFSNVSFVKIQNLKRNCSPLLIQKQLLDYDLACFLHTIEDDSPVPKLIKEESLKKIYINTINNYNFIENIINIFEKNTNLGLLSPMPQNQSIYFSTIGQEWGGCFDSVKNLAEYFGLTVKIENQKPPVAPLNNMFWFRPEAIQVNSEKIDENMDNYILRRLYPFIAQAKGYYSAWVIEKESASIQFTNLYYQLRDIHVSYMKNNMIGNRQDMLCEISQKKDMVIKNKIKLILKKIVPYRAYNKLIKLKKKFIKENDRS